MTHDEKFNPKPTTEHVKALEKFLSNNNSKTLYIRESPEYIKNLMDKCGVELDEESLDTNGWQLDYWYKGTYEDREVNINGGAWYGYAEISWE